jgi:cyclopropane fatty-acyl-phospholipid synthase-like methyltransferase
VLLDLAGSHGLLGAAICRRHPPLRSIVIDLPPAIEHGRTLAQEAGHADLVDHLAGDLRTDPLPKADVVLMSNILHHFTPEQTRGLLSKVHASLTADGSVAIWEVEAPRRGRRPGAGDAIALYFRLTSTAETPHGEEYAEWLAACGFRRVRQIRPRLSPGRVLIVGRR